MSWDTLDPFVAWLAHSSLGQWLGASTARIAWLLTFHLFGLTALLGSVFLAGLHLLGLIHRRKPVAQMAREIAPVMAAGFVLAVSTGALIFTGGAIDYYAGGWFRTKMILLSCALLFHFTVYRPVTRAEAGRFGPIIHKLTGAATLLLWFGVAFAGRAIAYF